jgi:hypothetical protein
MFKPSLLARACKDWLDPILLEAEQCNLSLSPLSLRESIMGVPRKRFLDPLPMSTGMGFPVFGPKNRWFTDIIEDGVLVDRLPAPEVVDEYERMLDCWRQAGS